MDYYSYAVFVICLEKKSGFFKWNLIFRFYIQVWSYISSCILSRFIFIYTLLDYSNAPENILWMWILNGMSNITSSWN